MDFDFDKMLKDMKEDSTGENNSFFRPQKEGTYKIRFLPPLKDEKLFYHKRLLHWVDQKPVLCLNQELLDKNDELHRPENCYACSVSKRLYTISNENSPERDLAFKIRRQARYTYRILDRKSEEKTPLFYESGKSIFDSLFAVLNDPEWGNILHPLNGRDYNLVKTGIGVLTKYDKSNPAPNVSPIFKDKKEIRDLLFDVAPKLKYSSTIEFISADDLRDNLNNFIRGSQENPLEEIRSKNQIRRREEQQEVVEESEEVVEENEEEELNDILNSFE